MSHQIKFDLNTFALHVCEKEWTFWQLWVLTISTINLWPVTSEHHKVDANFNYTRVLSIIKIVPCFSLYENLKKIKKKELLHYIILHK